MACAINSPVLVEYTPTSASSITIVAGTAADTIGHDDRNAATMSATGIGPVRRLRSATSWDTPWASQMAMAPTMMTAPALRASGWDSRLSPRMATTVAMVP